jgi:hypothetical protein
MNKEKLEEANWKVLGTKNNTFYNGAKWQAEKMYSEEEVIEIASLSRDRGERHGNILWDEWFEQFKKK